jgi:phytoene/squalene synthetase
MDAPTRTEEQVRQEIAREREHLAAAVTSLRNELRSRAPRVAVAAAVVVGTVVALRIVRRRRHGVVRARFGRYTVVER